MTALTTAVTDILTSCSTLLTSLFSAGSGTEVNALNIVAGLPIVAGVITVVVAATRKGRG